MSNKSVYIQRLFYGIHHHIVPPGYWTIFHQVSELMGVLEENLEIREMDLIDDHVCKYWSQYRKEQMENGAEWIRESTYYTHVLPDHSGDIEYVNAYHINELPYFWDWLVTLYIPYKLKALLNKKYDKDQTEKALNRVKEKYLPELPPGTENSKSKKKK